MSGKFEDRLGGYTQVKDRIRLFYAAHPDGRLVTDEVRWPHPDDDVQRISVRALAYRTPDDPHPGVGWSWLVLPGTTNFTRGSELENAETSAWGRAIGALGIGIGESIATGDEIEAKADDGSEDVAKAGEETLELLGRIQKSGTLRKGTAQGYDGSWKQTPEGHAAGFKLKLDGEDRDIPQVLVTGTIGEALFSSGEVLLGTRVTVKGHLYAVRQKGRSTYYRLIIGDHPDVDFVQTPDLRVPAAAPAEAPSAPLFSEEDQAAIDAALGVTA
jgi:hypothetical protein